MRVLLEKAARFEMWTAAQFYNDCSEGLGSEFLDAVDEAIEKIECESVAQKHLLDR